MRATLAYHGGTTSMNKNGTRAYLRDYLCIPVLSSRLKHVRAHLLRLLHDEQDEKELIFLTQQVKEINIHYS